MLAQVGVTTSGRATHGYRTQRGIGRRIGLGRQAICRWLGRLPELPGLVRDREGSTRGALRHVLPSAQPDQAGPWIWSDVVSSPAWIAAPLAWQWVFLGVLDLRATRPGQASLRTTHRELADALGLGRTTIEDAIRYWRHAGLLSVEIRTARSGQHLGLSLRDAGRLLTRDVPATRPSRLVATRRHVARALTDGEDRKTGTWAAAQARAAAGDVWGLAQELATVVRDALGRAIPIGRIARTLGTVTRSHVDRRAAEREVERRDAVRTDYALSGERPAPWVPQQGPPRLDAVPPGWSWAAMLRAIDDDQMRRILEEDTTAIAEMTPDGPTVWLSGDLFGSRNMQGWILEPLRKLTGMRIGFRPRAGAGPPA